MGRNVAEAAAGSQHLARTLTPVRYFAIDGGAGAHTLDRLLRHDPMLSHVLSPWHADLLLIVGPITAKLAPAVREVAQTLPEPAHALIVHVAGDGAGETDLADTLLPGARRVITADPDAVVAAIREAGPWPPVAVTDSVSLPEAASLPLPQASEMEIATELEVLSLGPLQPFTAGPVRFWLICDGDQVHQCRIESGYATRDVADHMRQADWHTSAGLAMVLDPLAPLAGRLAYVRAVEHLQRRTVPETVEYLREAALALERARNALWWATRLFRLMALSPRASAVGTLAADLDQVVDQLWAGSPAKLLAPGLAPQLRVDAEVRQCVEHLRKLARQVDHLARRAASDRLLALRMSGLGRLPPSELVAAGVTGPALYASERWSGDTIARLIAHLDLARLDMERATQVLEEHSGSSQPTAEPELVREPESSWQNWLVEYSGEATGTADGPRGRIAVRLQATGGTGPADVRWQRPSAALLALVPPLLARQTVADAGLLVASLDLSMAEADG